MESINEPIKVGAIFSNSGIRPKWFIWNTRRIDISEIDYTWKTKDGKNTVFHFAVSDGLNSFELSYAPERSKWELVAAEPDGKW